MQLLAILVIALLGLSPTCQSLPLANRPGCDRVISSSGVDKSCDTAQLQLNLKLKPRDLFKREKAKIENELLSPMPRKEEIESDTGVSPNPELEWKTRRLLVREEAQGEKDETNPKPEKEWRIRRLLTRQGTKSDTDGADPKPELEW
ncbi:hypothetical protein MMC14_006711 [Varicellaria rhodocarpa]|nr:hypothetical protein [Varicellaria rhodocarpa]